MFRIKYISLAGFLTALIAVLGVSGCGKSNAGDNSQSRTIAVSVEPLRHMLEDIVGDKFEVISMIPSGANPETFEPVISKRVQLDKSRAFFTTGLLPFEEILAGNLGEKVKVYNTSKGIELIYGTHNHNHNHNHNHSNEHGHDDCDGHHDNPECHHENYLSSADPHIWTSVKNGRIILKNMLDAVVEMDPENADYYKERYTEADARLEALDKRLADQLADAPRTFAVWHPSLSYFARDYGLKQLSIGQESKEVSPKQLKEMVEKARANGVNTFFFQKEYDPRQALALIKDMNWKLHAINPTEYQWEDELQKIANQIAENQ